jgi:DNA-binding transcriptional MerR regulator
LRSGVIRSEIFSLDPGTNSRLYNFPVPDQSDPNTPWRIGQLAKAAGVSADTLRHYERKGLLGTPGRLPNGYRCYAPETLQRVILVRRALSIGFGLDELSEVLQVRDQGGAPCRRVRDLAAQKLADVEAQLADILALRVELRSTLRAWDSRLAQHQPGSRSGLLEALAANTNHKPLRSAPAKRNLKRKAVKS